MSTASSTRSRRVCARPNTGAERKSRWRLPMMSEFELIDALRKRLAGIGHQRLHVGIGDDAAVWQPSPGHEVVACCDSLIAGRHFPDDTDPADIGWKALAVNLSDLAAMAATPVAALLALSLPESPTRAWLDAFCSGWAELAADHRIVLAGGDTSRGPILALTVTCLGELPAGTALLRAGACEGDGVYVSGTLGDAAHALTCWSQREDPALAPTLARLCRPSPRVSLGTALRTVANAAIDISDGLAADLGHVLRASAVGAEIELIRLPLSEHLIRALGTGAAARIALTGGDDYELCFTAAVDREPELCAIAAATATRITRIGRIVAGAGLSVLDQDGHPVDCRLSGWDHFRA